MTAAIALFLCCQLLGEIVSRALNLPVPGPVLGMIVLFLFLLWRGNVPTHWENMAQGLLQHLALFFVPAGVGVLQYLDLLRDEWLALSVTLIGSTLITLVVTAWVLQYLLSRSAEAEDKA